MFLLVFGWHSYIYFLRYLCNIMSFTDSVSMVTKPSQDKHKHGIVEHQKKYRVFGVLSFCISFSFVDLFLSCFFFLLVFEWQLHLLLKVLMHRFCFYGNIAMSRWTGCVECGIRVFVFLSRFSLSLCYWAILYTGCVSMVMMHTNDSNVFVESFSCLVIFSESEGGGGSVFLLCWLCLWNRPTCI